MRGLVRQALLVGIMGTSLQVYAIETEDRLAEALGTQIGELRFPIRQLDRGHVVQGEELFYEFPFEVHEGPVTILGVHQECGCTSLTIKPGDVLSPGQKGRIQIKADTRFFTGGFDKRVTFLTNEAESGVHVRATIERMLTLDPPLVELSAAEVKAGKAAKVKLHSASKQRLHIEKVQYNEDNLEVQFYPVQNHWELRIQWKGEAPTRPWAETIEVFTDSSVKTVKIPVVGGQHAL
jgi:hypothetical protein